MRNKIIYTVLALCFCAVNMSAQNMRERILMNQDWKFAKGHSADPKKDFNYGLALSFSKINFLQESTMLQNDQESKLTIPHTEHFGDSNWQNVSIPHDWGMELGFDKSQLKVKVIES
jgi:beta-galactosidase